MLSAAVYCSRCLRQLIRRHRRSADNRSLSPPKCGPELHGTHAKASGLHRGRGPQVAMPKVPHRSHVIYIGSLRTERERTSLWGTPSLLLLQHYICLHTCSRASISTVAPASYQPIVPHSGLQRSGVDGAFMAAPRAHRVQVQCQVSSAHKKSSICRCWRRRRLLDILGVVLGYSRPSVLCIAVLLQSALRCSNNYCILFATSGRDEAVAMSPCNGEVFGSFRHGTLEQRA